VSSIEPDDSGCEVDGSEEISGGFVVAGGDSSELFEFTEEILDQVARLVEFRVEIARLPTVVSGRDNGRFAGGCQGFADPCISIEGPYRRSAHQRPSEAAMHRLRPDRASAPASAGTPTGCRGRRPRYGFLCSTRRGCGRAPGLHLFLGAPALCWYARTMVLSIMAGLSSQVLKQPFPHPGLRPAAEPPVGVFQSPNRSGRSRQGIPAR
jgi:hypothetical protein